VVSCAPILRVAYGQLGGSLEPIQSSFLSIAMMLAFASLFSMVGVIMFTRQFPTATPPDDNTAPKITGWHSVVSLAPLTMYLGLPMANLFAPLWIWRRSFAQPDLREHARATLNFQITWTLFVVVALMLCVVLVGFFMLVALLLFHLCVCVYAAWCSYHKRPVKYPFGLVFVR
jgi:uncharacterized protein